MTSDIYEAKIHELAARHPLLDINIIGNSRMGKPIYALTLGHGQASVLFNAAHHANEWITALILTKFAEDCAKHNASWYEHVTLHMVPMVNPDGVDIAISGKTHWKANAIGVDLNSNYPAGWEQAKAHKYSRGYTAPNPRDYVGSHPLSEPESMAMAAFTKFVDPALTISLHTQGEEIYWLYQDYAPLGATELAICISQASGYKLEEVPDESSHAGYRDWFIQEFNRPGFTVECGLGVSPLPLSDFDDIYARVYPLLVEAVLFPIK